MPLRYRKLPDVITCLLCFSVDAGRTRSPAAKWQRMVSWDWPGPFWLPAPSAPWCPCGLCLLQPLKFLSMPSTLPCLTGPKLVLPWQTPWRLSRAASSSRTPPTGQVRDLIHWCVTFYILIRANFEQVLEDMIFQKRILLIILKNTHIIFWCN